MIKEGEPTLRGIDDYEGKGSASKRRVVWLVIISALLIGAIFAAFDKASDKSDILDTLPKTESK